MKRLILLAAALLIAVSVVGCSQNSPQAYYVMFEKPPNLFDTGVYFQGETIGNIKSRDTSPLQVTRVAISPLPEYREQFKTNSVFFVQSGRLHLAAVETMGEPVPPGAVFLGCPSPLALKWFRAKTAFSDTARAAAEQARRLFSSMQSG
jgi:hypothetical protein